MIPLIAVGSLADLDVAASGVNTSMIFLGLLILALAAFVVIWILLKGLGGGEE